MVHIHNAVSFSHKGNEVRWFIKMQQLSTRVPQVSSPSTSNHVLSSEKGKGKGDLKSNWGLVTDVRRGKLNFWLLLIDFHLEISSLKVFRYGKWRNSSAAKSTGCYFRCLEFDSQQPQGGWQTSTMRCGVLFWCARRQVTHIHKRNQHFKNISVQIW